jgi:hypothetical protein
MLLAKGNFGKFSTAEYETNGGIEAFCAYGLNPNLRDFDGLTIIEWIEDGKSNTSDTNLHKDYNEMRDYLVTCGCEVPKNEAIAVGA